MSTEFERLMRLAERNTVDIQQALLERKRHSGGHSVEDDLDEREAREKRRKLELEKRIKQREDEERARLAGAERPGDCPNFRWAQH
ncbi:hypothetical protein EV174_004887 [Coemansia sp. RSA 2320]|nr:hypothetical protein EV174_004887 [Coemansia sp. RSA 2320]